MDLASQRVSESANQRVSEWLLLVLVEILGLHLHYTLIFLVAYVNLWALLTFWRAHRWAELRRWLIAQAGVGLACAPWLIAVLLIGPPLQSRVEVGMSLAEPFPLDQLLKQVWAFHLTGMAGAWERPAMRLLVITIAVLLLLLIILKLKSATHFLKCIAPLIAHWLIPLSAALLIWIVRPFSHPRYLILFTPGLTLLTARLVQSQRLNQSAIRNLLFAALLALSLLGLHTYFFAPSFAKDDMRVVARHLEDAVSHDDLILVPDGDWTLPILYQGEAPVEMPGMPDEEAMWANLHRWTLQPRRVFLMSYPRGINRDPRDLIPFALEKAGSLQSRRSFDDIQVRGYELEQPVEPPTLVPVHGPDRPTRFGPLTLTGGWVESAAPADTALTLALRWRLEELTAMRCHLTIRLRDIDGWPLATRDEMLLNRQSRPTDQWPADQRTTTYHILPIPPGTPPLTYTLALGLYERLENGPRPLNLLDAQGAPQAQQLELATVRLTSPLGISLQATPYGAANWPSPLPRPLDLADGLRLLGADLDRAALGPGQSLFVRLHWRATAPEADGSIPDLRPRLALVQGTEELDAVASAPALERYPTDRWRVGESVVEHRRLKAPPTAADGPADVTLSLGEQSVVIGKVEIDVDEHIFELPPAASLKAHPLDVCFGQVARLIGYELPAETFAADEPIPITLYWQALEEASEVDYTVFTHLLQDGDLVGQHDGPPAQGSRPTTGWLPGEIIIDVHKMTLGEARAGPARIEVGLYDRDTMKRVPLEDGQTFALLPTTLTIRKP